jgi:hypothetical protein
MRPSSPAADRPRGRPINRDDVPRIELQRELHARGLVGVFGELNLHVNARIADVELPAETGLAGWTG